MRFSPDGRRRGMKIALKATLFDHGVGSVSLTGPGAFGRTQDG